MNIHTGPHSECDLGTDKCGCECIICKKRQRRPLQDQPHEDAMTRYEFYMRCKDPMGPFDRD